MKTIISCIAACAFSAAAQAATTLTFWDFLGGGDGVRMKQIVEEFNKSQSDIHINESTLTWGEPFYTKVHTAVVAGQTPDVMTYHLSHFPAGILAKDLRALSPAELEQAGLKASDFQKSLIDKSMEISQKFGNTDQLFGVPLDIHTLVLYYNKTALQKAGLLGADGKPTGLENIDAFTKMLAVVKAKTHLIPVSANIHPQDPASLWRVWYTLFKQQGGDFVKNGQLSFDDVSSQGTKALQVMADWAKEGLIPKNTSYPSMVALFTAGRTGFMFNGNWEVPTLVDLQKAGKLPFEYGIVAFPKLYENRDTWADSHQLAIPNNAKTPAAPEKVQAALKFIAYVVKQQTWAGGGHIPAYLPVQESEAYKQMAPNNEYSPQAAQDVSFEPSLPIFGVGGPTFNAISNFLVPAVDGQLPVDQGIKQFTAELQKFTQQQQR
ncbi:MAG: extracellular solute-binding protein [Verrucomicrobia bacterium]|nr:extracellular solute-binding protein [Verrucomicrobiota bacterium]